MNKLKFLKALMEQKERLEQELRFLKESFEADVISREEFEKGKDRIERKLKELSKKQTQKAQAAQEIAETKEEEKEDKNIRILTSESEPIKEGDGNDERIPLSIIQDEGHDHETDNEPAPVNMQEETEMPTENGPIRLDNKGGSRFFKYGVAFVVLLLVVFFSYSLLKSGNSNAIDEGKNNQALLAECESDSDCRQEGKIGVCINAGNEDAKCQFEEIVRLNLIVLNDMEGCFNCGTQRVISILETWFGKSNVRHIDYNSVEGQEIADYYGLKMLPAYIFDENLSDSEKFKDYRQVFAKNYDVYILKDDAAGSTYYIGTNEIQNRLDMFVKENDAASIRAEKNLQEFLGTFRNVQFERHTQNSALAKELGIKTFPTFLINNKVKFSGLHTADSIKTNFCKMNDNDNCQKSLSKNLILE